MYFGYWEGSFRRRRNSTKSGLCMPEKRSTDLSEKVEEIYRNQGRELWALFYAQCCDADRAYDALQEAFLRLYQQNGSPIRDIRAWLLQVGRNWLRDVARRRKVAARSCDYLDSIAEAPREPSEIAEKKEIHALIRRGISQLKLEDREVLVLRYSMGWPSARIAETLNSTASAVDMRLSRARRRLAEILEKAEPYHE